MGDQNFGLTDKGKELIREAVKLNIAIDISHLNFKTANETIDYLISLKEEGLSPTLLASHSNCFSLTPRNRNIPDEIIKRIGEMDGIIGILPRKGFCSSIPTNDYDKAFISHVRHVVSLIGIDKVCIASDDMEYHPDKSYWEAAMYDIRKFSENVHSALISGGFTEEETNMIMVDNFKNKVLNRIKTNK